MKKWIPVLALPAGMLLLGSTFVSGDRERRVQPVEVVNFPEVQQVAGRVSLDGPLNPARLERRTRTIVPPTSRSDVLRWLEVETVSSGGFRQMVLSLQGEVKGEAFAPGAVGAVLVPDEKSFNRLLSEEQRVFFPVEVAAGPSREAGVYFGAQSGRVDVAFPRYRIFFYNETSRSVELNLFIYLTD